MYNFNLEAEGGKTYNYKVEGDTICVNQFDIGNMIFLRVEKEDVTDEQMEKLKESIAASAGNVQVVILPPWVSKMRLSNVAMDTPSGRIMECPKCGGKMRQLGNGAYMCFSCGNETAPPPTRGVGINLGGMP